MGPSCTGKGDRDGSLPRPRNLVHPQRATDRLGLRDQGLTLLFLALALLITLAVRVLAHFFPGIDPELRPRVSRIWPFGRQPVGVTR